MKIDDIKLQQAKLHPDPAKCALQMMAVLFTTKEMVNGNPSGLTNSKDENRRKTIQKLDANRMKYIIGIYYSLYFILCIYMMILILCLQIT